MDSQTQSEQSMFSQPFTSTLLGGKRDGGGYSETSVSPDQRGGSAASAPTQTEMILNKISQFQ